MRRHIVVLCFFATTAWAQVNAQSCPDFDSGIYGDFGGIESEAVCTRNGSLVQFNETVVGDECSVRCTLDGYGVPSGFSNVWACTAPAVEGGDVTWENAGTPLEACEMVTCPPFTEFIASVANTSASSCSTGDGTSVLVSDAQGSGNRCSIACDDGLVLPMPSQANVSGYTCSVEANDGMAIASSTGVWVADEYARCVPACSEDAHAGGYLETCCADLVAAESSSTCAEGFGGCSDDAQCTGDLLCGAAGESCPMGIETAAAGNNMTRCCIEEVLPCDEVGTNYYVNENATERAACPAGLPGNWATCPEGCAQNMQAALDDLAFGQGDDGCCNFRWYINGYAGPSSDHGMYTERAVANVVPLCELNTTNTCHADPVTPDTPDPVTPDTETCFELARAFFGTSDDLVRGPEVDPNPCPGGLPGNWEECPAACANGMQVAIDELDCCVREYLNEFAGPGIDHGTYTDMAFNTVMTICDVELTESSCFEPFVSPDSGPDTETCFDIARNFFATSDDLIRGPDVDMDPCPNGLPGNWEECPAACAAGMQVAIDELDCCVREYLNEFAGPGFDHGTYTDMAFDTVMTICDVQLTDSSCFEAFVTDDNEVDTEACFDLARGFFGSSDDLVEGPDIDPSPCPSGLPGNWEECSAACADGMQAAVDELDCCVREYLNEFAGPGVDHGAYTDMAFDNVFRICNVELTESSCFEEFTAAGPSSAARSGSALFVSVGTLLSALMLSFL